MKVFHITAQVHESLGALNLINDAAILLYDLCESSRASNPASSTLFWNIIAICWALAVLTEYKNVSKRTHQYAQNQEDIMKEATIFPSPQKKHFAPPTLLERCDLGQLILETWLKRNVSVIK